MRNTKGEGVDIIFNSLTGILMSQSFKTLCSYGQFVEIGKADTTYLITGGASGLGLRYTKFLADCGAEHLVLVSRSSVKKKKTKIL